MMAQFLPNMSNGPCFYCNTSHLEFKPEEIVRCELCRRVAHLSCLRLTEMPKRLLGDNFFNLLCRHCTHEEHDKLSRVDLKILHLLLLVLYNLHLTSKHKSLDGYFHYEKHIWSYAIKKAKEFSSEKNNRALKKLKKAGFHRHLTQQTFFQRKPASKGRDGGWYRLTNVLPPAQILSKINEKSNVETSFKKHQDPQTSNSQSQEFRPIKEESSNQNQSPQLSRNVSPFESIDDSSSRGSWFTEKDYLRPDNLLPESIFANDDDEDEVEVKPKAGLMDVDKVQYEVEVKTEVEDRVEDDEVYEDLPLPSKVSLFEVPVKVECKEDIKSESSSPTPKRKCIQPMTIYEERELLAKLNRQYSISGTLPPQLYRLRRKLCLRNEQREHNVPVFDIDDEVKFLESKQRPMTRKEKLERQMIQSCHRSIGNHNRILDRFQIVADISNKSCEQNNLSFFSKLMGVRDEDPPPIYSPYTLRTLKPYIYRDYESLPLRLKLLQEIIKYPHRKDPSWKPPDRHPIDFCYVTSKHIPAINSLARRFFWPGIELSEILQYPDFTCIVQYHGLVIGFGIVVPDISYNEAYISFLFVHPEWQGAGIGKFMLYHLIQTCNGKDITLHVSVSNPAVILYQKFGFKVEEFLNDFYDKYFPIDSTECKHAMFMRMLS